MSDRYTISSKSSDSSARTPVHQQQRSMKVYSELLDSDKDVKPKEKENNRNKFPNNSNEKDKESADVALQTTNSINRIKMFRALLMVVLVVTGVLSSVLSYVMLHRQEETKYRAEFSALVQEIFVAVNQGFNSKSMTLDHMSTILSFHCPHAHQWPNCSIGRTYYEALTDKLIDVSHSRSIASNPIVYPHQQESFENFAYELFDNDDYPPDTGMSSFGRGMFGKSPDGSRYADDGKTNFSSYELFVPVFQPADLQNNWRGIMYNMHSEPVRAAAIDAVLDCVSAQATAQRTGSSIVQRCSVVTDFIQLVSDSTPRPASILYSPVFPLHDNTTVVGMNTIIFNWDTILQALDLFSDEVVDCVVESAVGGESLSLHTFELSFGVVHYVGEGNQRSSSKKRAHHSEVLTSGLDLAASVQYTLHFYSTDEFYDKYHTALPVASSLVCVFIIVVISGVFVGYDVLVKRESVENKMLLDSKRVFVKFVSHEIRTPLNTITLGLQLLSAQLESILGLPGESSASSSSGPEETVTECLDLVQELSVSSKTAVVVLNELINYDKIEMKKFHVEMKLCDINTVVNGTVRPLVVQAKQSKVTLTVQKDPTMDKAVYVMGDAVKLGQVIRNVLSNALKFAPKNSTVFVAVQWLKEDGSDDNSSRMDLDSGEEYRSAGNVTISVRDSGPGLSEAQQKSLFQEGVQFNPNDLQAGQGSGLGLWISREIMSQHGGAISVESEGLGKGSTFTVTVPVLLPAASVRAVRSSSGQFLLRANSLSQDQSGDAASDTPSRVLVVDDAITSVKILTRLLKNAGMEVTSAYNGSECLDKVNQCSPDTPFDLIIMDFEMPVMNGPDATKTLREAGHTLPIIGVTGNVLPEDKRHFIACGADWVLPKPLSIPALLSAYASVVLVHKESEVGIELDGSAKV
mmetsp:Transcript_15709/g.26187  ORF Transcript_15709/g.26187 Transcript_15709/m.26187 type:complete len:916 (+) Transcript_15709:167-2914(+)